MIREGWHFPKHFRTNSLAHVFGILEFDVSQTRAHGIGLVLEDDDANDEVRFFADVAKCRAVTNVGPRHVRVPWHDKTARVRAAYQEITLPLTREVEIGAGMLQLLANNARLGGIDGVTRLVAKFEFANLGLERLDLRFQEIVLKANQRGA